MIPMRGMVLLEVFARTPREATQGPIRGWGGGGSGGLVGRLYESVAEYVHTARKGVCNERVNLKNALLLGQTGVGREKWGGVETS